jgi:NAD(P)-dependent dehydrogenase (short-subunit alcohol dehydrogenase family)
MTLQGKRALVTGASRGIGEAVARELAAAGADVVLVARTVAEMLAEELGGVALACDVSDPSQIQSLARQAGAIDILVNNAGSASSAPLRKLELQEWQRLIDVNATSTFLCTQTFLPGMLQRGWGRVVNVASVAGLVGSSYLTAYTASKHAVLGFTRSLAAEVAAQGVTVNAVCPGFVDTPMTQETIERIVTQTGRSRAEALESLTRTTPQKRLIEAEEVAYAVLCLCDPRARGINGQALVVDGGALLA